MTIKPCPHCRGASYLASNYSYKTRAHFVFVRCEFCGSQGKIYHSPEDPEADGWDSAPCRAAVKAWNMRDGVMDED